MRAWRPGPQRPGRRAAGWAGALVLGSAVALAVPGLVARSLTRRPEPPRAEPVPEALAGRVEPLRLLARDGVELWAWFAEPEPGAPLVILLHGLGGSRSSFGPLVERLSEAGYGALAVTLRAHGDSEGSRLDFGWSSRADVAAAVALARRRAPHSPLAVAATSLGTAAALYAVGEEGVTADGFVLEAPYLDLDRATELRLRRHLAPGLDRLAHLGLRLWDDWVLGVDAGRLAPLEHARRLPAGVPVVLLCGAADPYLPPEDRERFARAAGGEVRVVVVPGGGHGPLLSSDPDRYASLVLALADELASAGPR